jgi:poly [ADP-ribose] polymerase 2/3/4
MSLASAKSEFEKKFKDKTKNHWSQRESFVKHNGKYHLLAKDYGSCDEPAVLDLSSAEHERNPVASALDERVQKFIALIADVSMMESCLREIG